MNKRRRIVVITKAGDRYEGETPRDIIKNMKLESWCDANNIIDYKNNVAQRICASYDISFVYWDDTSFLQGFCNITEAKLFINWVV